MAYPKDALDEVERQAFELVELAEFCRLPTGPAAIQTNELTEKLKAVLNASPRPEEKIGELIGKFRRDMEVAHCPVETESFIGSVVAWIARSQEKSDCVLVTEFEPKLLAALTEATNKNWFSWANGMSKSLEQMIAEKGWPASMERRTFTSSIEKLFMGTKGLMHAAIGIMNFDAAAMPFATQHEIDSYFHDVYYRDVHCANDMWIDVGMEKDENLLKYYAMGKIAYQFTDAFFTFLRRISDHPRCSIPLRVDIRTRLIGFTSQEAVELRGWEEPFDVSNYDLRVTKDDIAFTNANSSFYLDFKPEYLLDA